MSTGTSQSSLECRPAAAEDAKESRSRLPAKGQAEGQSLQGLQVLLLRLESI